MMPPKGSPRVSRFGLTAVLLFLIAAAAPASAAIRPSFNLNYSVWKATHIVLATEGEVIDGRLSVLESWKGDLKQGAEVILPELAAFAEKASRQVDWWGLTDLPPPYARYVTGSKMVLFMVKSEGGEWVSAGYWGQGGFKISVAWIERGEAYAFKQVMNPGPTVLTHLRTGLEMKARIAAFVAIQTGLGQAVEENDPILAAQALRAFRREKSYYGSKAAIDSLSNMGKVAVPMLRQLLSDRTLSGHHRDIIPAMAAAGGEDVAGDFAAMLDDQLEFWSERAPGLKKGWWNADPANERSRLRREYGKLLAVLRALQPLGHEPSGEVVSQMRDLWQSQPVLNSVSEGQVVEGCNAVLRELSNPEQH